MKNIIFLVTNVLSLCHITAKCVDRGAGVDVRRSHNTDMYGSTAVILVLGTYYDRLATLKIYSIFQNVEYLNFILEHVNLAPTTIIFSQSEITKSVTHSTLSGII
ncbi:hypothetical protein RF11_07751 [Thelohanellus kitauei]|uniref:Uncharacterized protein n=1 Tax=Thelohanellus kitauei TaxID=669202 RepID=A0A0C2MRT8_THEKT|nr:hypothetical protein RF11_07751 [Thelohanellus kitauei]